LKKITALILALLITLTLVPATAETTEEALPSFEMMASNLNIITMMYYDDYGYLFGRSYSDPERDNLDERLVYCKDGRAIFVTHGGDAQLQMEYEQSGDGFILTRVIFSAYDIEQSSAQQLLSAMAALALQLDITEFDLFSGVDTTPDFIEPFTTGESFTMNGVTISNYMYEMNGQLMTTVCFDGLSLPL